jgi:hypothetical protein
MIYFAQTPTGSIKIGCMYLALLLCAAVGCSGRLERAIVGKWQMTSENTTMEFFPDGTYTFAGGPLNLTGTFKPVASDKIKIEFSGLAALGGPTVWTASIAGDDLTWTTPDGKTTLKFRRVK